jgi:hypothetical protein
MSMMMKPPQTGSAKAQSVAARHALSLPHLSQSGPPLSTLVSRPFLAPSEQLTQTVAGPAVAAEYAGLGERAGQAELGADRPAVVDVGLLLALGDRRAELGARQRAALVVAGVALASAEHADAAAGRAAAVDVGLLVVLGADRAELGGGEVTADPGGRVAKAELAARVERAGAADRAVLLAGEASTSVSRSLLLWSTQETQLPSKHLPLARSFGTRHALSPPQLSQNVPPQSTSVS